MNEYGPYFETDNKKVEGSPYLFKGEWVPGKIQLPSGHWTGSYDIRYNTTRQELEVKLTDKEEVLLVPPKNVNGFNITHNNKVFAFSNGFSSTDDDINDNSLLQIIYDGKTKLLKFYNTKYIEGRQRDFKSGLYVDKFIPTEQYYLMNASGQLVPVKLKKKDILNILDSNRSEINDYVDEKGLKFKHEKDITLILIYYDTISG